MDRKRMAELLISEGILTDDQVRVAVQAHTAMGKGARFGDYLVELGLLTPRNLAFILGRQFHLDVVRVDELHPEPEALHAVGRALAERLGVLPLSISDGQLTVAVSDPLDFGIPKALASESKLRVRIVLASPDEIANGLARFYGDAPPPPLPAADPRGPEPSGRGPAGDLLIQLVRSARQARSAELILAPVADGLAVQLRSAAGIRTTRMLPQDRASSLMAEVRSRAGLTPGVSTLPRDGRASLIVDGVSVQLEVALLPTLSGERGTLSLQVHSDVPPTVETLPMSRTHIALLDELLAEAGGGLILLTGLPGEDLRGLLLAIARRLDPAHRVVTFIEDGRAPLVKDLIQVAVRPGPGGMSFEGAIAAALRQEPDAIVIADLRDAEAARLAFEAALGGAQVVCGMQSTSAARAVERLLDLGVEGGALSRALRAVGVQRWGSRICGACREPQPATEAELRAFKLEAFAGEVELFAGRGCSSCDGVGLVDAVAVQGLAAVGPDDERHLLRREPPWELFSRLHDALVYDAAAKAIGGYITGKGACQLLGAG